MGSEGVVNGWVVFAWPMLFASTFYFWGAIFGPGTHRFVTALAAAIWWFVSFCVLSADDALPNGDGLQHLLWALFGTAGIALLTAAWKRMREQLAEQGLRGAIKKVANADKL